MVKLESYPRRTRMPGKEEKSQFPSCNRAFALRMMNPNSYRQGQVSIFDREIQPVVKRPIAKIVSLKNEDSPYSTSSSADTSYQDMELYDIEENLLCNGKNRSRLGLSQSKGNDELGMRRSYTSVDGFNNVQYLKRTCPSRITMPARLRRKKPDGDGDAPNTPNSKVNSNKLRFSALPSKVTSTANAVNKTTTPVTKQSIEGRPKTPVTKLVKVNSTRSSQLRAKGRCEGDTRNSEAGSPTPTANDGFDSKSSRSKRPNDMAFQKNSTDDSFQTVLQLSSPVTPSISPDGRSSPINIDLPQSDEFSKNLSEICDLITEKYPGDFQILETLVNMQTAFEERELVVKKSIETLHKRVNVLEEKLRNAPNIPSLIVPLLRASNAFQTQLQNIVECHRETLSKGNRVSHKMNGYSKQNAFDEIYMEANSVAEQILSRQNSNQKSMDESQRSNSISKGDDIRNGANSPSDRHRFQKNSRQTLTEENHCNGTIFNDEVFKEENNPKKLTEENKYNNGSWNIDQLVDEFCNIEVSEYLDKDPNDIVQENGNMCVQENGNIQPVQGESFV